MNENGNLPGDESTAEPPAQSHVDREDSPPPPRHRVSWLGVFATTVLCLFAANIAFGAVCTASFFLAVGNNYGDNWVFYTGLYIAAFVAVATFAGLFYKFVIPKWRDPRQHAIRSRDSHERENLE
ncbi:MAG: hypothetical protein NT069_00515 [Planctomycetota bacterium]|nr:hypothetical protein [Planctomycetota bacterium]